MPEHSDANPTASVAATTTATSTSTPTATPQASILADAMPEGLDLRARAAAKWQIFLALDYGLKRTGVATGTRLLGAATPQGVIAAEGKTARLDAVAQYVQRWQPDALVVGVPFHPDGAAHENTARARKFIRQLHGRFGLPVLGVDERYSTTAAYAAGAQEGNVDAMSACVILEQFLRELQP